MVLSFPELIVILALLALLTFECYVAIRSRAWIEIYRPTLFVAVVLCFYALLGPLRAILSDGEVANFVGTSGTYYRDVEHRSFLFWGWLGALLFYLFFLFGYYFHSPKFTNRQFILKSSLSHIRIAGDLLCFGGFFPYLLIHGDGILSRFNPFWPEGFHHSPFGITGIDAGILENYFLLSINLLIPGVVIKFSIWLRERTNTISLFTWILLSTLIYLSEAFRYRILLLVIPILLLWLFYNKLRPRLVLLLIFMFLFVSINGALSIARTYSYARGVDLSAVIKYSPLQIFNSSFEEAGVFLTSSAIISKTPSEISYSQFKPIYSAILQPIPRAIFPSKPTGSYSSSAREYIYNTPDSFTAYLNYAEYYLAFGWPGLVFFSFLLGVAFKRLWIWFLWRQYEPLPQAIYLLNTSFIYVIISRGYLPQMVMLYVFTVLPSFVAYYALSERNK